MRTVLLAILSLGLVSTAAAQRPPTPAPPRYLEAIERELETLRIAAVCETESPTRVKCSWRHRGRSADRELQMHLVYSDETDTIYFYVERFVMAPPGAETTLPVLRRLMELNWQMLVGKFEWDPSGGEVRLSIVMNTDSNFDRRSFRSILRTLGPLADRHLPELERLAAHEPD